MSTAVPRYVCIHGHFYQPPRENPWLEAVEIQDTAAPYHDWNERITRECYAPNSRSRLIDSQGKILHLINNYAWMSFNFGPTLLSWMEESAPQVLQGVIEGDRLSRERRGGHGNALAQVYNHAIMPLASDRDKRTQAIWGIADFRKRFQREPEGMWLPETAVDLATLEMLVEFGIRFTILAPRQAKRWRKIGQEPWDAAPEGIDPSRAYLCRLPSGKSIALFFYDGAISRQVAFERLLDTGEKFHANLLQGFDDKRQHPQLVHIATDGESYGHHHAHGDMALAAVHFRLNGNPEIRLTNYGEYLERHPPEWEVEIHENSSWSCVHGVERWRSNCGCNMGRGWQQEWRGPLRDAMNQLKTKLDRIFSVRGRECFPDPWLAFEAYICVVLNRSPESVQAFLKEFGHPDLDETLFREALWLLEMQRHGLLMFTSCGWFFDEISGLETTQCLRYVARAIQLARHFQHECEEEFVQVLEKAPSNLPDFKNGRGVWEQVIRPARIDLSRVLAHHAMSMIYSNGEPKAQVYCYDVESLDHEVRGRGNNHVAVGRLRVHSRLTWNRAEAGYVVLHYGGLDFHTVLRPARSPEEFESFKKKLLSLYEVGSLADVTGFVAQEFGGEVHRLDTLFTEEQRRIIAIALKERFADYQNTFERLADGDEDLLNQLGRLAFPIPKPLRAAASVCLDSRLLEEIERLDATDTLAQLDHLVKRGKAWGHQLDTDALSRTIGRELHAVLREVNALSDLPGLAAHAGKLLDAASLLGISLNLWEAQNQLLDAYAALSASGPIAQPLQETVRNLAIRLRVSPDLLGWRP